MTDRRDILLETAERVATETIVSGADASTVLVVATHDAPLLTVILHKLPEPAAKAVLADLSRIIEIELRTGQLAVVQFNLPLRFACEVAEKLPQTAAFLSQPLPSRAMRCIVCEGKLVSTVMFQTQEMTPIGQA